MKMSTFGTAVAAVVAAGSSFVSASVSASSVTLSTSLRSSVRVIADTAKRRTLTTIASNAASMSGAGRYGGSPSCSLRRGWNGLAFTSSIHHAPSHSSSAAQRYFTGKHYKEDNNLPWSPIIETDSTSLHMTPPNYGTEGFRDAIRGSQDYIKPRGPDRDGSSKEQQQKQPAQQTKPDQSQSQPQQQQPVQTQQQTQPGARIPFPKLTPGRQRNYRPPHVVTAMRVNSEISQQHQQYNQSQLQQQSQGAAPPAAPQPMALSTNTAAEKDYCDALADPADREHCLEDFRDGKISAGYLNVKGPKQQQQEPKPLLQAEKDYCDALADPADREHCLEDFRDGKSSAGYLNVRGPKVEAPEAVSPQVAIEAASVMAQMSGLADDGDKDEEESDDDELRADDDESSKSHSEKFRDLSRTESKFRSGSDVDISSTGIDSLLRDEDDGDDDEIDSDKLSSPFKKSSFYDNPRTSSMNFRDGTQRSRFKDPTFRVDSNAPIADLLEEQEQDLSEEEKSAYEELLGNRDDEDELLLESLLKDADIEEKEGISEALSGILDEESMNDKILSYESQLQGRGPTPEEEESTSDRESSSKSTLLSIDPQTINFLPLDKARVKEEGVSEDRASLKKSLLDSTTTLPNSISSASTLSPDIKWGDLAGSGSFVKMFRGSASYIANHRSTLAVYHIPGELLAWEGFPGLMDDIALTWLLGMKIVLVAGCRHQIDLRLDDEEEGYHGEGGGLGGRVMMSSIRVTDEDTLRVVKEEAGFVRFEIERRLAKSLRLHGGLVKGSESLVGNVVSGNFYSAQPFGVVDGIDYRWTGFPRKVEIERIRQVHETNDIVLLTSLGVSPSGEIFNVNSEFLAASVAGAMSASKIIYFNVHGTSFQNKSTGKPVQNLRVTDAKNLLAHYKMKIHPKGFALVDLDGDSPQQSVLRTPGSMETLIKVGYSMVALEKGVKRAHILAPENGALVQELYTRDGCGTLISRDIYEGIRRADVNDVSGIYDLIDPLVRMGTLVERPKSTLEKEILSYYVYTRDGLIVATGQLKRYEGGFAEIGCLVVSKDYRKGGRGDAMLGYLERLSLQCGAKKVFVLSTQTMEWFVERGFREVPVESLPPSRQAQYNRKRNSKIYMKEIDGDRDLDAAELWWSNSI